MKRVNKRPVDHFEGKWKKGKKYTLYANVINNGTKFRSLTAKDKDEPYVIYDSANETFSANPGWEIVEMSEDSRLSAMGGNGGGASGQDGKDAGFGTISASVANTSGNPSVAVETSGPDTAKNIYFKFFGLKGNQGIPGVNNADIKVVDALPAASAQTTGRIYLVETETANIYARWYTEVDGSTYAWRQLGTTEVALEDYATKDNLSQLQQEVTADISQLEAEVTDKIDSFHEERTRQDYSEVLIDADGKILESRDATGAKTEYTDVTMKKDLTVEKDLLVKKSATVKENLSVEENLSVGGEIGGETSDIAGEKNSQVDSAKYVKVIVDGDDKIVAGIEKDGTIYIPKLRAGNDVLSGKKWAVCGDSFTNGSASLPTIPGGLYAGKKQTYGWLIGHRCNMVIQHMAIGGRTIATPANLSVHNCFTDLASALNYSQIAADVDYITLYFGINDAGNAPSGESGDGETPVGEIPFGELTDTTPNTFCGAWNYVLPLLLTNHPFAHIGIIVTNGVQNGRTYSEATKSLANKWGIPWIDLNGDRHTPFMIRSNNPLIPQSVKDARNVAQAVEWGVDNHPNASAHLYESYFIEQFLRSI